MEVGVYLCLWSLLVVYVKCASDVIGGQMDSEDESICGGEFDLNFNDEVNLMFKGNAPNGSCAFSVKAVGSMPDNCSFKYICVNVTDVDIPKCKTNASLTMKTHGKHNITRWLGCGRSVRDAWCTVSETLSVSVTESKSLSKEIESRHGFNVTVYTKCRQLDSHFSNPIDDFIPVDLKLAIHEERLLGIGVGVGLCSIFLVIFFVTYLYYRNKNVTRIKSES